ncbi:hypothetical protein SAY87_014351 [Trapa incisa]|uniref:Uncharacterized protein n=1 Tax=Trapa incisa TaxID=236973 RepID=A0AAN7GWM7_9MYRT|nr:hypothetical protein SAY87_014351 [Trapa incisa]
MTPSVSYSYSLSLSLLLDTPTSGILHSMNETYKLLLLRKLSAVFPIDVRFPGNLSGFGDYNPNRLTVPFFG